MNNDVNDPFQFFPFLIKRIDIRFTKAIHVTIILLESSGADFLIQSLIFFDPIVTDQP